MEAEGYFETLIPVGHTAKPHFLEDKNFNRYWIDNLKSHEIYEQMEKRVE
jgi:hypothetical protein